MRFDEKTSFPYPVLGVHDDIMPRPGLEYTNSETDLTHIFDIHIKPNNPPIEYYIDHGKAEYVCEVECKSTFYRECFSSQNPSFQLIIPKDHVSGEVSIAITVSANNDIHGYENSCANDDYSGYAFDLERGDIMAYIGTLTFQTDIKSDEYKAVGSFLHFIKGKNDSEISYYLGGQDIEITLPREMFEIYTQKLKGNRFRPAILASIVNEALIFALAQYRNYEQSRWARLLRSAEILKDYDFEDIDLLTAIEMTRLVLKQPHQELFSSLAEMTEDES